MFSKLKKPISKKESGKLIVVGLVALTLILLFSFRPSTDEWNKFVENSQNTARAAQAKSAASVTTQNKGGFFDFGKLNLKLPTWNTTPTTATVFEQNKLTPTQVVDLQPEPVVVPAEESKPRSAVPIKNDSDTQPKDVSNDLQNPRLQPVVTTATGKIRWENTDKFKVISDKFTTNTMVNVQIGNTKTDLQIDNWKFLDGDVLLVVNQQVFRELGGNPAKQQEIEATVTTR